MRNRAPRTTQRGEGNSTAIVAIVVLFLVAVGLFFYFGGARRAGPPGQINVEIEKKAGPAPEQPPGQ